MKKVSIKIAGMHCANCAANITKSLEKTEGITSAKVNFSTESASVQFDELKVTENEIKKIVKATGYNVVEKAHDQDVHAHLQGDEKWLKLKVILATILTLPVLIYMFWQWQVPGELWSISFTNWIQHDLTFLVVFIFGWQFHRNAFKALKRGQADMDMLISIGTLAAYFYSVYSMFRGGHLYFESAATITTLILLGRFMEQKTKGRASSAMQKLMELGVKKARVIDEQGKEIEKDVDQVKIGEIILVKPSEKIALDGEVVEGQSNVDESMLSGESLPVYKTKTDQVYGATINKDGVLKIKITKAQEDTVLAQIIKTVEEAQHFKAPMQKLADKIASIFVPIVIGIAILTFAGWFLVTLDFAKSLINAVAVLVISCPCALGIATPIAIMVGSSVGARGGILIKNGESFEKAKNIDTIIFDKTGTLTKGEPRVREVVKNKAHDFSEEKILRIASSLAKNSEHPLSQAVVALAQEKNIAPVIIDEFKEVSGQGVVGQCEEHTTNLLLGNQRLIEDYKLETEWVKEVLNQYKEGGGTVLFVAHDTRVVGALLIEDEIRQSAKQAIDKVKEMGIEPIIISGDNKYTVAAVAQELGVEKYLAEVLPNDKQKEVKKLQAQGKRVIFAGDGINDAPALVQADLGIAMASGTDIAKEAGDIIIMQNEPIRVADAIQLSKKTFRTIKQNLFWAFFYNIVAIPFAVAGIVNPMFAALAMSFSDVTVIGNSIRIYKK
ncbi:heavy metal translocating P-type ATPase [Patescibacteria group bacterium]